MRIQVRNRDLQPTEAIREHVERRLLYALSRYGSCVRNVTVCLSTLVGNPGVERKHCQIAVALDQADKSVVVDSDADIYAAIDRAVERTQRAVGRALERARLHALDSGFNERGRGEKP